MSHHVHDHGVPLSESSPATQGHGRPLVPGSEKKAGPADEATTGRTHIPASAAAPRYGHAISRYNACRPRGLLRHLSPVAVAALRATFTTTLRAAPRAVPREQQINPR